MRVQIDQSGHQIFIVTEPDHAGGAQFAGRQVGVHLDDRTVANDNAGVPPLIIADRVK